MAQDGNGRDRKAAGRPDGGQFEKKTGQGSGDIHDNLGGIADGAAMDGYGVGSEDPR